MKFTTSMLALAGSALANQPVPRDDYDYGYEADVTYTTYTTVTTCPVTSTYTEKGTTYCITDLTTSTITVTECDGCEKGKVTTVPGPTKTAPVYTDIEITYTTVCPTTETIIGPTKTEYKTYTTTSVCVTHVPTTYYESVAGPEITKIAEDVEYSYITSLCPVTETTTIEGKEVTITYTTTSLIETHKAVTDYETEYKPGKTQVDYETDYETITSLCPVTETLTISGKEVITTYTTTKTIVTQGKYTEYETESLPGNTQTAVETDYTTITSVCPVTETKTVSGQEVIETYTTTKTIVTKGVVTDYETKSIPGKTEINVETDYVTLTSLCPVTETKTINGEVVTQVYTTTETIITHGNYTRYETKKLPDQTQINTEVDYVTYTSLCPVTETKTINGEVITEVYTTTETIVTQGKYTEYETKKLPDQTQKNTKVDYVTYTSLCPVTETKTINGEVITEVYTTTETIVTQGKYTEYATKSIPGTTEVEVKTDYETITSLCPITETKTVNGEVVTEVYTSTQVIVTQVPTTIEHTVSKPGETETEVQVHYETQTKHVPVTEVKTVNGEEVTEVYTSYTTVVTEVPTTIEAYTTIYKTLANEEVVTEYSKVYVTVGGGTVYVTVTAPPETVVKPQTSVVSVPPVTVTTSEAAPAVTTPVEVPVAAADAHKAPGMALMAVVGAMAFL